MPSFKMLSITSEADLFALKKKIIKSCLLWFGSRIAHYKAGWPPPPAEFLTMESRLLPFNCSSYKTCPAGCWSPPPHIHTHCKVCEEGKAEQGAENTQTKRQCYQNAALNMSANLEDPAVATGLENVSPHSISQEGQH